MNALGVPPLLTHVQQVINSISLVTSDIKLLFGVSRPKWGIYKNNNIVLIADTVIGFDYRKEWRIARYPMEKGAFQDYNKVEMPYESRVRLTKGGTEADRSAFISAVEAISESLDLYDIVTPEKVYQNVNVSRLEYRRTSTNGVGLLTVELLLMEIRETATESGMQNTAVPSGADPVNGGNVQPQIPNNFQQTGAAAFT